MSNPHHKSFDPKMNFLEGTMDHRMLESVPLQTTPGSENTDSSYAHNDPSYTTPTTEFNDYSSQSSNLGAFFGAPFIPYALPPRHFTAMGPHLSQFFSKTHGQESQPMIPSWDPDFAQSFDPLSNVYQDTSSTGQEHKLDQQYPTFESAPLAPQDFQHRIQTNSPTSFLPMQFDGISQQVAHAFDHLDYPTQLSRDQHTHRADKHRVQKQKRTKNTASVQSSPILLQLQATHGGFAHQSSTRLEIDAHKEGTPFSQSDVHELNHHRSSGTPTPQTSGSVEEFIAELSRARQSQRPATLILESSSVNNAAQQVNLDQGAIKIEAIPPPLSSCPRSPDENPTEQASQDATATTTEGANKSTAQVPYVSDYQMQFGSFSDAKLHCNRPRWQPAIPDNTLPIDNDAVTALARCVMHAMNNIKGAKDYGSAAYKHWLRVVYPSRDVEAVAFAIVHEAYRLHTCGSTLRTYNFKNIKAADVVGKTEEEVDEARRAVFADRDLNFEERMNAVIDHLTHWKSTCDYAMTGEKISWLVNAPLKYDHKVATNQRGNRSRALRTRMLNGLLSSPLTGADDEATPPALGKRKRSAKAKRAANDDGLSTSAVKTTSSRGPKTQMRKARVHTLTSVEIQPPNPEASTSSTRRLRDRSARAMKPQYVEESSDINDDRKLRKALLHELKSDTIASTNCTVNSKTKDDDTDASYFQPGDAAEDGGDDDSFEAPKNKKHHR